MRHHYNPYPKCTKFRKHRVSHLKLLEQLLGDKLADGRNSIKITDVAREGALKRKLSAWIDVRKQAILNSTEEAGFERLAMAIKRQNESKMGLAMQRVMKLGIFKDNIEAIGCLDEAFFADEKKADFFLNLPTKIMVWWIEKEFGSTIKLDTNWNAFDIASNQIGVETARKRIRVSKKAGNSDLYEDINEFEYIEEGNGDNDEFIDEVGSEDEFIERFRQ